MKKIFETILKRKKNRRKFTKGAYYLDSLDKYNLANNLLKNINKKINSRNLIQESRKQFIISLVTFFEFYFRELLITLIDSEKVDVTRLSNLVDEKFKFEEILFMNQKKITYGELVASQFSFQSINVIDKIFSNVLNLKFIEELKEYKWVFGKGKEDYIDLSKDSLKNLDKLLNLRHDFTHDINFDYFIHLRDLDDLSVDFLIFLTLVDSFIEERLPKKRKKKIKRRKIRV